MQEIIESRSSFAIRPCARSYDEETLSCEINLALSLSYGFEIISRVKVHVTVKSRKIRKGDA
jgi:hypothetical protein